MASNFLEKVFPKLIDTYYSPLNGNIDIYRAGRYYSLRVNGLHQSGQMAAKLWLTAFKRLSINPKKILILGLGGGSVVKVAQSLWPQVKIVGIEIDPVMIQISQDYFNLKNNKNLKIISANAFSWIKKNQTKFDLIVVDLFHGRIIPPKSRSIAFISKLKASLNPKGVLIFNQLNRFKEKQFVSITSANLQKVFENVKQLKLPINWLLIAQR